LSVIFELEQVGDGGQRKRAVLELPLTETCKTSLLTSASMQ